MRRIILPFPPHQSLIQVCFRVYLLNDILLMLLRALPALCAPRPAEAQRPVAFRLGACTRNCFFLGRDIVLCILCLGQIRLMK
jgi:hypothetical protein